MKFIVTRCPICGSGNNYTLVYRENFREEDLNKDVFSARRLPDRIHYRIVRCNRDGLLRSNPILDNLSIIDFYKKSRFTYESEIGNLIASYLSVLDHVLVNLNKSARILEVGCGNGFMLKALCDRGYKNVFGIEPSIDAVQRSDAAVKDRITPDVLKPGIFPESTFDLIFCFQTFDHIQDPNSFLRLCHQLLAQKGSILIFNHDIDSLPVRILREYSPVIDIEHTYFYSGETLKKILEIDKFRIIKFFSASNLVSLRHLVWLMPFSISLKKIILNLKNGLFQKVLNSRIRIKLGNLCIIAVKNAR